MTTTITELRELMATAALTPNEATAKLIRALPAILDMADAAKAVVKIDADPAGSVDANGIAIDRLAAALAKMESAK